MTARAEFAYAQARLHARHGRLADAPAWQRLEASRTSAHYLALTRTGPLAGWIEGMDEDLDAHRVELHLRTRWRRYVDEIARWLPPRWQPATRWFAVLTDLPLIDMLLHGGPAAPWMHADAHLAAFAQPQPLQRSAALRAAGLGAFAAPRDADRAAAIWLREWHRLAPAHRDAAAPWRRPAELLLPRLRDAQAERSAVSDALRLALVRLFRRCAGSPAAVFAHLALVALDLERLRGGIVVRRLFERAAASDPGRTPAPLRAGRGV